MGQGKQKVCFVIQGFGEKTDFETGRKLNLDNSYAVIKEAVVAAGLQCIRADEVQHSGIIDTPMYQMILDADLVIADLSTSNPNALYELGVRHAVRPHATIIVAEERFTISFDINHNLIRKYKHLGEDIGNAEAKRFKTSLTQAINAILQEPVSTDSPLYTYIPDLQKPVLKKTQSVAPQTGTLHVCSFSPLIRRDQVDGEIPVKSISELLRLFRHEKAASRWPNAIGFLNEIEELKPDDVYIKQQLALATYKSNPKDQKTLENAKLILLKLDPENTHDAETLGLWGSIHKRLWQVNPNNKEFLDQAIGAYKRGFSNSKDYYNGINYAYLLNARVVDSDPAPAIADWVEAERIRRAVIEICNEQLKEVETRLTSSDQPVSSDQEKKYWILATLWEACIGIGDHNNANTWESNARNCASEQWMLSTTESQIADLKKLLSDSPLKHLK